MTQQKLTPAAGPRIEPIAIAPGEDLRYRAIFEVFPEVALKSVDGLEVARPAAEVTEADVDAMVENLRAQRPNFEAVEREGRDRRPRDDGFRRPDRRRRVRGQQG